MWLAVVPEWRASPAPPTAVAQPKAPWPDFGGESFLEAGLVLVVGLARVAVLDLVEASVPVVKSLPESSPPQEASCLAIAEQSPREWKGSRRSPQKPTVEGKQQASKRLLNK